VPYLVVGTNGSPTRSGLGKSLAGVKWRLSSTTRHPRRSVGWWTGASGSFFPSR
jgi:hypothetical protein